MASQAVPRQSQCSGCCVDVPEAFARGPQSSKKKGCKQKKCSKWKGGKCRCGRD